MTRAKPTKPDRAWRSFRPSPSLYSTSGVTSRLPENVARWVRIRRQLIGDFRRQRAAGSAATWQPLFAHFNGRTSTTVSPLKNDGGPTVEQRYGHHRLNGAQLQRYGNFLTRTVHVCTYHHILRMSLLLVWIQPHVATCGMFWLESLERGGALYSPHTGTLYSYLLEL